MGNGGQGKSSIWFECTARLSCGDSIFRSLVILQNKEREMMSLPSTGRTELVGMKKIEAIKKKMDKLNKEKPGTVVLNPPVSMDKVKEFRQ